MKQTVAIAAALLCLSGLSLASAATPIPAQPPGQRLVQDFAAVLTSSDAQAIEAINQDLKNKTGVVIVVVTVPELEDETIDEFGLRVGETWGVGRKGEDRGIVVALSLRPRKVTVQTGYGVEGYLPDGRVGQMLDDYAIPYFRKNNFSSGLVSLDKALVSRSAKEFGVTIDGSSIAPVAGRRQVEIGPRHIILGILALIALIYMGIRHPRTLMWLLFFFASGGRGGRGGGGFGGGGFGGFGGGGFGGGGASRGF